MAERRVGFYTLKEINVYPVSRVFNVRWMHIADERDPPAWGRIPFPEDIVGTVLVKDGVIQPNTYQAMPAHRLVTAHGIFQLPESLTKVLIDAAKKRIK